MSLLPILIVLLTISLILAILARHCTPRNEFERVLEVILSDPLDAWEKDDNIICSGWRHKASGILVAKYGIGGWCVFHAGALRPYYRWRFARKAKRLYAEREARRIATQREQIVRRVIERTDNDPS